MSKTADKKPTMYLIDPPTLASAQALNNVKQAIAALNKKDGPKDSAEASFDTAMERYISEFDPAENWYCFGDTPKKPRMLVKRAYNQGAARIDREKLLERGVDPAIIDHATDRTPFEYWRMEELPPEQPAKGKT